MHYSSVLASTKKYNKNLFIAMKPAILIPTEHIFQDPIEASMRTVPPLTSLKNQVDPETQPEDWRYHCFLIV